MKVITNNRLENLLRYLGKIDNYVFLDTSKPDSLNKKSLLFIHPVERLQFFEGQDEAEFMARLQMMQQQGFAIAGWFSYEFGYLLEQTLKGRLNRGIDKGALLADLGAFQHYSVFDHGTGESDFPLDQGLDGGTVGYTIDNLRLSLSEQEYISALEKVLEYIAAGDTYQVNYTLKLFFDFSGSPEDFYATLRRNQSVSYGAYLRFGEKRVMSFSPELFFWKDNSRVLVRPMKGTYQRGKDLEEDQHNKIFLQTDIKNQSENVMIVDLLRNDLGRLMHEVRGGEVKVDSLFDVETYETLLQMTSTISGTSAKGLNRISLLEFFKAIFPCGSVTGAPKIRTMEIIDELEKDRRGVYTGAIGYLLPGGENMFNVPIRTVVLEGTKGEMGIGSGIVHDSVPRQEWQECLLKGRFLTAPTQSFELFETLLWTPEHGYFLLEEHLKRLSRSAEYFLFHCDTAKIIEILETIEKNFNKGCQRIRILFAKDGKYDVEVFDCQAPGALSLSSVDRGSTDGLPRVMLSANRVESDSTWLRHKTTRRELYTTSYNDGRSNGYYDILFMNECGHITEGCITNVIVEKGGKYLTPPITDGLLPRGDEAVSAPK